MILKLTTTEGAAVYLAADAIESVSAGEGVTVIGMKGGGGDDCVFLVKESVEVVVAMWLRARAGCYPGAVVLPGLPEGERVINGVVADLVNELRGQSGEMGIDGVLGEVDEEDWNRLTGAWTAMLWQAFGGE